MNLIKLLMEKDLYWTVANIKKTLGIAYNKIRTIKLNISHSIKECFDLKSDHHCVLVLFQFKLFQNS